MSRTSVPVIEIAPRNLLSFGPDTEPLRLQSLNVLIGPNGSGKSNFIEALSLLRGTTKELRAVFGKDRGGVGSWIWRGAPDAAASLEVVIRSPYPNRMPLRHHLAFGAPDYMFALLDERIENERTQKGEAEPYFYYRYQEGRPVLNVKGDKRFLARESVQPNTSILSQRRDPDTYPEITYLADLYEKFRVYSDWTFGRNALFRKPQMADMRNDRLEEDMSNLGMFLNRLRQNPQTRKQIITALRDLYEGLTDFDFTIEQGTVQVFFTEQDFYIPATRLSDGTIRYLSLLAILCDPDPPPLICIEEPELGLHPDLLPKLADLLRDASQRTQLIITTHSDILVSAMTDMPEVVVVCEKHDGRTVMKRLDKEDLKDWLDRYRLGDLWTRPTALPPLCPGPRPTLGVPAIR